MKTLVNDLRDWRAERPDEWTMDRFIEKSKELEGRLEDIALAIHYPDCWDTLAFPTLLDAIKEIGCNPEHCTK